jgi:hypothetical protein
MARLPAPRRAGRRHSAGRVRRCVLAVNHVAAGRMLWWRRGPIVAIAVVAIAVAITITITRCRCCHYQCPLPPAGSAAGANSVRARRRSKTHFAAAIAVLIELVGVVGTLKTGYPAYKFQVKTKGEACKSHASACP